MVKVRAHSDEVRRWRENETYWKLRSEHTPHLVNTIMADDTSAWRAPHFTNRPIKEVATKYRSATHLSENAVVCDAHALPALIGSSDESSESEPASDALPTLISSSDDGSESEPENGG